MRIKPQYILEIKTATMKMKHVRKQKKISERKKRLQSEELVVVVGYH